MNLSIPLSVRRGARRRPSRNWSIEQLEQRCYLAASNANVETILDNGSHANRVDIVFLGDGYTQSEIDTIYPQNIDTMLHHMFFEGEDPFPRYQNFFNVTRIDVISKESGVDDPENRIKRDTALNATYRFDGVTDRLASITDSLADAYVNKLPFRADMKFVTLNSSKYGGAGGPYAVFAGNDPSSAEIALHEQGHSFAGLADEYEYGGSGRYSGGEPSEPNVTKSSTGSKWAEWLGYNQPGIGIIGAYEGGYYSQTGIFRPSQSSKMRDLGQPFDAISREAFIQHIYDFVSPIDASLATSQAVSTSATLWVDVVDPGVIDTQWFVDDQAVPGATGPYFVPAEFGFVTGTHTVTLKAGDNTEWVRRDKNNLHEERQWKVDAGVSTPGLVFANSVGVPSLTEGGLGTQFQIKLSVQPTSTVTIDIGNNGELSSVPNSLQFTPDNWDQPQVFDVQALADGVIDGNDVGQVIYQISSTDTRYDRLVAPQTRIVVRDTTKGNQGGDQPPNIYSQHPFSISQDAAQGTVVGMVLTKRGYPGQTLLFEILGGNENNAFAIDSASGVITVQNPAVLDINVQPTYQLAVQVSDQNNPSLFVSDLVIVNLVEAPILAVNAQPLTGVLRSKAVLVDPQAQFIAVGTPNLAGAVLSISIQGNGSSTTSDTLALTKDQGIRVSGKKILAGTTQVGLIVGGKKGQPLSITFNPVATPAIVQAILRSVSFKSTAKLPGTRAVKFQIDKINGTATNPAQREIQYVVK